MAHTLSPRPGRRPCRPTRRNGKMRAVGRRLGYLLVWTVATLLTVGASWLGIRSALVAAAPTRTQPLSAERLRQAAPTTPVRTTAVPTSAPATGSPTPLSASAGPSIEGSPSATPEQWVPVPDGQGGTAYRRVFHVRGGQVTLLLDPDAAKVLSVQPAKGYTVQQTRDGARAVLVSFISAKHTSRVFAAWRDAPYAEITESVG